MEMGYVSKIDIIKLYGIQYNTRSNIKKLIAFKNKHLQSKSWKVFKSSHANIILYDHISHIS